MEHTQNYQLSQWSMEDRIMMEDFNGDNQKIDAALHTEAEARAAAVQTLTSKVAKCGNCSIGFLTYQGTGEYGAEHPTVITFPRMPAAFIVAGGGGLVVGRGGQTWGTVSSSTNGNAYTTSIKMTWSGNACSFYSSSQAKHQMNSSGTHMVIAFYAEG